MESRAVSRSERLTGMLELRDRGLRAHGRVALLANVQPSPLVSMLAVPLVTMVLPTMLLGHKAEIPVPRLRNNVLAVAVPSCTAIP